MNGLHDVSVAIGELRKQGEEHGKQLTRLYDRIDDIIDYHDRRLTAIESTITEARGIKKGMVIIVSAVSAGVGATVTALPKAVAFIVSLAK